MPSTRLPVINMVIELGALYSAALIAIHATYTSGNNSSYIILVFVRYYLSVALLSPESFGSFRPTASITNCKQIGIFPGSH
jgi:hypothetical protein